MVKANKKFLLKDSIISVILITKNDQPSISSVIKSLQQELKIYNSLHEILVVDNDSTDNTVEEVSKLQRRIPGVRIIVLSREYHRDIALTAGLDSCIGDQIILFDKKYDSYQMLHQTLDKLYSGYDMVIGNIKKNHSVSFITRIFLWVVEKLSSQNFQYRFNFSMGLSRKAVNSITRVRRKSRNFSYINFLIGLKKTAVEYPPGNNLTKYPSSSFIKIFLDVVDIMISNSFKPIRFITVIGMVLSSLFLIYIFVIVVLVVVFKMSWIAPQGWISLATVLGALFFLLFSVLTIISEYIIRLMNETKEEPLYFISEELDHTRIVSKGKQLNIV